MWYKNSKSYLKKEEKKEEALSLKIELFLVLYVIYASTLCYVLILNFQPTITHFHFVGL